MSERRDYTPDFQLDGLTTPYICRPLRRVLDAFAKLERHPGCYWDCDRQVWELTRALYGLPRVVLSLVAEHYEEDTERTYLPQVPEVRCLTDVLWDIRRDMTDLGYEVNPHYGGDEPELPVPRQRQGRPPRVMPILDDDDDD
jgi:hypothetical protein